MSQSKQFIGVDLGGTNYSVGIARADRSIVAKATFPTLSEEGPHRVLARIGDSITQLLEPEGGDIAAIGMGVPGLIDLAGGNTIFLPNLPGQWRDFPVGELLSRRFSAPVQLLNDARAATLGEWVFGREGKTDTSLVFVTMGTGIGGGIIMDGALRLGHLGAAGEIGHIQIDPAGPRCGCGSRGCLEIYASGPAITAEGIRLVLSGNAPLLREICGGDLREVSPKTMAQAVKAGETSVAHAIEFAGVQLGRGLAHVVSLVHPPLIVLGGGVSALFEFLVEPIRATLQANVRMFPADDIRIERSTLGNEAGMLGGIAAALGYLSKTVPPDIQP